MDTVSGGTELRFQFVIARGGQIAKSGDLGLTLFVQTDTKNFRVTEIKQGCLVASQNQQIREATLGQPQVSETQLRVNDVIREVNGHADHEAICRELERALVIHMAVVRQGALVAACPQFTNEVTSSTAPVAGSSVVSRGATDIELQYEALDSCQFGADNSLQAAPLEEQSDGTYEGVTSSEVIGVSSIPEVAPTTNVAVDWTSISMAVVIKDYDPHGYEPESGYLTVAVGDKIKLQTGSLAPGTEGKERYREYVYGELPPSGSENGDQRQGWLPTAILQPERL